MAVNKEPIFIGKPLTVAANTTVGQKWNPTDTTDIKDIITGATDGTVLQDIIITSTDTSTRSMQLYFRDEAGTDYPIGMIQVVLGSGTTTGQSISGLNTYNIPALAKRTDGILMLAAGQKLRGAMTTTVTADKEIAALAIGGNLTGE
jgi:hypothetical protein